MNPDIRPDRLPAADQDMVIGTTIPSPHRPRQHLTSWLGQSRASTGRDSTRSPHHVRPVTTDAWQWQLHARCRGMPADVFFTCDQDRGRRRLDHEMNAKRICRNCPVIRECRDYAVEAAEPYGIWGGMSAKERAAARYSPSSAATPAS